MQAIGTWKFHLKAPKLLQMVMSAMITSTRFTRSGLIAFFIAQKVQKSFARMSREVFVLVEGVHAVWWWWERPSEIPAANFYHTSKNGQPGENAQTITGFAWKGYPYYGEKRSNIRIKTLFTTIFWDILPVITVPYFTSITSSTSSQLNFWAEWPGDPSRTIKKCIDLCSWLLDKN